MRRRELDKLEIATLRAEEAQRILGSDVWQQAFGDTRQAILEALAGLPSVNDERAGDLHRMVRCLDRVKRALEEHVTTGKLAQKEIESRSRLFAFRR